MNSGHPIISSILQWRLFTAADWHKVKTIFKSTNCLSQIPDPGYSQSNGVTACLVEVGTCWFTSGKKQKRHTSFSAQESHCLATWWERWCERGSTKASLNNHRGRVTMLQTQHSCTQTTSSQWNCTAETSEASRLCFYFLPLWRSQDFGKRCHTSTNGLQRQYDFCTFAPFCTLVFTRRKTYQNVCVPSTTNLHDVTGVSMQCSQTQKDVLRLRGMTGKRSIAMVRKWNRWWNHSNKQQPYSTTKVVRKLWDAKHSKVRWALCMVWSDQATKLFLRRHTMRTAVGIKPWFSTTWCKWWSMTMQGAVMSDSDIFSSPMSLKYTTAAWIGRHQKSGVKKNTVLQF